MSHPILKPYISLDIETTGLDLSRSQILQISAIYDDGTSSVDNLRPFDVLINQQIEYAELGALVLHEKTKIFSLIQAANKTRHSKDLRLGLDALLDFIEIHQTRRSDGSRYRITLAGKNIGSFDVPILRRWMTEDQRKRFDSLIYCSFIDVGSLYLVDFGRIPSLSEILKMLQMMTGSSKAEVTHNALEDCFDVVCAIRYKMGMIDPDKIKGLDKV